MIMQKWTNAKMDCHEILVKGERPHILRLSNEHENPAILRLG